MSDLEKLAVRHNDEAQEFALTVDGQVARLAYHREPGIISLDHTLVPPAIEGRGVAAKLTKAALEFARAEQLRVLPACSYVAAYMRKNPEYQDLLAK